MYLFIKIMSSTDRHTHSADTNVTNPPIPPNNIKA
jgi:hypothetical protein